MTDLNFSVFFAAWRLCVNISVETKKECSRKGAKPQRGKEAKRTVSGVTSHEIFTDPKQADQKPERLNDDGRKIEIEIERYKNERRSDRVKHRINKLVASNTLEL
jgi:hypothetical protein